MNKNWQLWIVVFVLLPLAGYFVAKASGVFNWICYWLPFLRKQFQVRCFCGIWCPFDHVDFLIGKIYRCPSCAKEFYVFQGKVFELPKVTSSGKRDF